MTKAKHRIKRIGLIPAAGIAERIAPLPCSKEIYPIGFQHDIKDGRWRPKAICQYLLEGMNLAGVDGVFVVLRKGKWDILEYLGDGNRFGMPIGYLLMDLPYGAPFTLDQAYPFVKDAFVFFGFPDILFSPADSLKRLAVRQAETGADIVLGLFPADNPRKMDMVAFGADGRINRIEIKPANTQLKYTWIIGVWTPKFTEFMHAFVAKFKKSGSQIELTHTGKLAKELYVGHVLQEALATGMSLDSIAIKNGRYIDIGTPDDLRRAVKSE